MVKELKEPMYAKVVAFSSVYNALILFSSVALSPTSQTTISPLCHQHGQTPPGNEKTPLPIQVDTNFPSAVQDSKDWKRNTISAVQHWKQNAIRLLESSMSKTVRWSLCYWNVETR